MLLKKRCDFCSKLVDKTHPVGEFVRRLDRWMGWYRSGRLREFREGGAVVWDTIDGRRARLGLAV